MLDVQEGMTAQDKKIANRIEEAGKGCLLLFNKWDLVKGFRMEHCLRGIEEEVPFLKHCPKVFISATTGRNISKIFPLGSGGGPKLPPPAFRPTSSINLSAQPFRKTIPP